MKLFLDTQILIWLVNDSHKLSHRAREVIENENNQLLISIASLWEITIKITLNKLQLKIPLEQIIENYITPSDIEILPIYWRHLLVLRDLPLYHRDPFDRLIIAQSLSEVIPVISSDTNFNNYPIKMIW